MFFSNNWTWKVGIIFQKSLTKDCPQDLELNNKPSSSRPMQSYDKVFFIKTIQSEQVAEMHRILKEYHQVFSKISSYSEMIVKIIRNFIWNSNLTVLFINWTDSTLKLSTGIMGIMCVLMLFCLYWFLFDSQYIVERHAETLMPQYLGMYRVTINDSETYLLVSKNIFSRRFAIHKKYDLKVSCWNCLLTWFFK